MEVDDVHLWLWMLYSCDVPQGSRDMINDNREMDGIAVELRKCVTLFLIC